MDNEKLIELVQEYPELYDITHQKYSDNQRKEEVWIRIGENLDQPASKCKKAWVNLRDCFRRAFRKKKDAKITQEANNIRRWKYDEEMSFLIPYFIEHIEDKSSSSTSPASEVKQPPRTVYASPSSELVPSINRKRKIERDTPAQNTQTALDVLVAHIVKDKESKPDEKSMDPIDLFFASIAATVKSFSKYNQSIAKVRILEIVSNIEMQEISPPETTDLIKEDYSESTYVSTSG